MTFEECQERARQCVTNAGLAVSEPVALEFMRMAAQWRAIGERTIFLGSFESPARISPVAALVAGLDDGLGGTDE